MLYYLNNYQNIAVDVERVSHYIERKDSKLRQIRKNNKFQIRCF